VQNPWRPEEIRSKELNLTVEAVTREEVRLRLAGSVSLNREKGKFPYGYDARLMGLLVYDRVKGEFTRFDMAALGDWTWRYERKGGSKDLYGVALELSSRPFASPAYDRHFPGYSMSNYGYRQERE
jgi:hypothetical protein